MNSCKFLLIFVGFCFFSYEKQVFFSHFLYICRRFMANKKKIVFILNPISGTHSKKEIPEIIERTLDHDQFDAEIKLTEYAGHASEIAKECANEGRATGWPVISVCRLISRKPFRSSMPVR